MIRIHHPPLLKGLKDSKCDGCECSLYGAHVQFQTKGRKFPLYDLVKYRYELRGMKLVQCFFGGRLSMKRTRFSEEDIEKTKAYVSKNGLVVYTHFPYTASLTGCNGRYAHEGNVEDDAKMKTYRDAIVYETGLLGRINRPGCGGSVIHPGSVGPMVSKKADRETINAAIQKGIQKIIQSLDMIKFERNAFLVLENSSAENKGMKLPSKVSQLGTIFKGVSRKTRGHLKVCIDTAHTYGSGEYDFGKSAHLQKFIDDITEHALPIDLIHLNDSVAEFGSGLDRHGVAGFAKIWGSESDSIGGENNYVALCVFIRILTSFGINICFETTCSNVEGYMDQIFKSVCDIV